MDERRAQAAKTTLPRRHYAIGFWRNLRPSNSFSSGTGTRALAYRPYESATNVRNVSQAIMGGTNF